MAKGQDQSGGMEPSLARYIWQHTRSQQLWILAIVVISMVPYFLALDLPKRIVNGPIQGQGFSEEQPTQVYGTIGIPLPEALGGYIPLFEGVDLDRFGALAFLCGLFLFFVCVNGLFKFYINTFKGPSWRNGLLRRLRYELVDRVLRFPYSQFKRVKPSEISTMVKDEVEPLGGFIGDAFVLPVFLGGQALTALIFILVQSVSLGMIALVIVLIQAIIIPKLRRILIALAKQRQLTARELSGRVGEIVEGVSVIRTNDTSNYERADITQRLGRIFAIRYEFFYRKFFIKFLNNFLAQITPFLFYAVGGYFAIKGTLDIGQLVAVIAAYKDLPAPVKDLINWDQQRVDVQVKYAQVTEQFSVDQMIASPLQAPVLEAVSPLSGDIEAHNIAVVDDSGAKLIESASYVGDLSEQVAIIGTVNSGAETFVEVLSRLQPPTTGNVTIGGKALHQMTEAQTGRRIGYAAGDSYLAQGSVLDSILYPLRSRPIRPEPVEAVNPLAATLKRETELSGNIDLNFSDDWTDLDAAQVASMDELNGRIIQLLQDVELGQDIYELGLRQVIDPTDRPELAESILKGRATATGQADRTGAGSLCRAV